VQFISNKDAYFCIGGPVYYYKSKLIKYENSVQPQSTRDIQSSSVSSTSVVHPVRTYAYKWELERGEYPTVSYTLNDYDFTELDKLYESWPEHHTKYQFKDIIDGDSFVYDASPSSSPEASSATLYHGEIRPVYTTTSFADSTVYKLQ
jgi:hypothetical protein